jgi:hypothetical protein
MYRQEQLQPNWVKVLLDKQQTFSDRASRPKPAGSITTCCLLAPCYLDSKAAKQRLLL